MQTKYGLTIKNKSIMKFKVTKKEKELYEKLNNVCSEFEDAKGTILASFALGEDFGGNIFCGEAWKLQESFYEILKNGLRKNANETELDLFIALLGGINKLISERSVEANRFTKSILNIYNNINEAFGHNCLDDDEIELEVTDQNEEPKEEKAETLEAIAAKLDKMGYYISKKPQKKDNKQPKNKK